MKKIVCLALALCLLLCAAGAWAAPLVNGTDVAIHKNSDYWKWDESLQCLTIKKSGLTVSDWGSKADPVDGYISFSGLSGQDVEDLSLTLENVHLEKYINSVINSDASSAATLRLTLNNSTLTSTGDNPAIRHSPVPNVVSLYVNGMDTTISGGHGIWCQANYDKGDPSASMYLSGSLTISGTQKAVECTESEFQYTDDGEIYIVGTEERAVIAECKNDVERWALNKAKPYTTTSEDIYNQIANEKIAIAKVLWLKLVSDGVEDPTGPVSSEGVADLPQTGDSSRLALWGAMLAIALAGAGILARKNREA